MASKKSELYSLLRSSRHELRGTRGHVQARRIKQGMMREMLTRRIQLP